jgi:hypothetical protein
MKTVLFIIGMALTVSLSAGATNVTSVRPGQTENVMAGKTSNSARTKSVHAKKVHAKKHHPTTTVKKKK